MPPWRKTGDLPTIGGEGEERSTDRYHFNPAFLNNPGMKAESGPGPEPPKDSPEWPAWKAHARAWRRDIGQWQTEVDNNIAQGMNLEDMGIFNIHEQGQAGYRRREALGNSQGIGWEYNWATGQKRNTGTSDVTAWDKWEPISQSEYEQKARMDAGGGGLQGYYNNLRSGTAAQFGSVMAEGGASNGITKTSWGGYKDPRPNGTFDYYDASGNKTDENGQKTGGSYYNPGGAKPPVNTGGGYTNPAVNQNGQQTPQTGGPSFAPGAPAPGSVKNPTPIDPMTGDHQVSNNQPGTPQAFGYGMTPQERNRGTRKREQRGYVNRWS